MNSFRSTVNELEIKEIHMPLETGKQLIRTATAQNKGRLLHIKLSRLAKKLKKWNRERLTEIKAASDQAQQLVLQLDQLQE
jgi:hypothetical protein